MFAWPPAGSPTPSLRDLHFQALDVATSPYKEGVVVSERLVHTLESLCELSDALIEVAIPPVYEKPAYIRASAFMVLGHAALEDYVEGMALEVIDECIRGFRSDRRARIALMALSAYSSKFEVPEHFAGGPWHMEEVLREGRQRLFALTEANHGVRDSNLLSLWLPIGLKESDMGPSWLDEMRDFGTARGDFAHKRPGAKRWLDPGEALQRVEKLLPPLCRVDARLCALRDE